MVSRLRKLLILLRSRTQASNKLDSMMKGLKLQKQEMFRHLQSCQMVFKISTLLRLWCRTWFQELNRSKQGLELWNQKVAKLCGICKTSSWRRICPRTSRLGLSLILRTRAARTAWSLQCLERTSAKSWSNDRWTPEAILPNQSYSHKLRALTEMRLVPKPVAMDKAPEAQSQA